MAGLGAAEIFGGKLGTAGPRAIVAWWRAFAFKLPPSLEILRNLVRGLELDSLSSAENVLSSSLCSWRMLIGSGEGGSTFSDLPRACKRVCVRFRRGLRGGTGGGGPGFTEFMPLARLAPGGRFTVSTDDVLNMNIGSEISCLLIERLRDETNRGDGAEF